jgi:hypothetical protein
MDRVTDAPGARRSSQFFDAICSDLHFTKKMVFIAWCGLFGAVLETA